jgi:solute carrier family 15 (oligopeptide transporter), member 1
LEYQSLFIFTGTVDGNQEEQGEKLKYPRAIPFIISSEFCERFNYYGMRSELKEVAECRCLLSFPNFSAILVLYLTRKLMLEDDDAVILYHIFSRLGYFFCIFGAILADSFIGKFKTSCACRSST